MRIPSTLIMLPCLAAFFLCLVRFYQARGRPGIFDVRFLAAAAAILTMIAYLLVTVLTDNSAMISQVFLGLALGLLILAALLFHHHRPAR